MHFYLISIRQTSCPFISYYLTKLIWQKPTFFFQVHSVPLQTLTRIPSIFHKHLVHITPQNNTNVHIFPSTQKSFLYFFVLSPYTQKFSQTTRNINKIWWQQNSNRPNNSLLLLTTWYKLYVFFAVLYLLVFFLRCPFL